MKKRTKRLLAMLLASAMILQQGSTVGVLATESEPASETVAETTAATEAETKAPETQAPETKASETTAPETTAPETQVASETQATEAATSPTQTETSTSETTETAAEMTEKVTEAATTEATEAPAETGKTLDAEAETADATEKTDKAEETEAPKTNFTYEDSRVKITAVAQEAAKLPQDAQIHADYMQPGTAAYNEAATALEAAYAGKDVVLNYVFYDIYFTAASAGNGRIEPEAGTVTINMQFKQLELKPEADAEVQTYDVVHVENGKAQEVPSNVQTTGDGSVASVGFTSDSFSPYAVVMSVEEQDEVVTIGADGELEDRYTYSDKLQDFLDALTFSSDFQTEKVEDGSGNVTLRKGRDYSLHLSFKENEGVGGYGGKQFKSPLTYKMPEGFTLKDLAEQEFSITVKTKEGESKVIGGNKYQITDGTLHVTLSEELGSYADVEFYLDISAHIEESITGGLTNFGDDVTKTVVIDESASVSAQKTITRYDDDGTAYYEIVVRSDGSNTNIHVEDTFGGNILQFQRSVNVKSNKEGFATPSISYTDKGFSCDIPSMSDGEEITFTYSAKVDWSKVTGTVTTEDKTNTVTVYSNEDPDGGTAKKEYGDEHHQLSYDWVNKSGEYNEGQKTITWTLEVNKDQKESAAGLKVTDTIDENSRKYLSFKPGQTVTIHVYEGDRFIQDRTFTLSPENMEGNYGWNYTIPATDKEHKYRYVFEYTTEVNTNGLINSAEVKNNAEVEGKGESSSPGIEIEGGHAENIKEVVSSNETEVEWRITVEVPATELSSLTITDTLPGGQWINEGSVSEQVYDSFIEESLKVSIDPSETLYYNLDNKDKEQHKFTLTFYKDAGKTKPGLSATSGTDKRTITVIFKTKNNEKWVAEASKNDQFVVHTNTAKTNVNGYDLDAVTAEASIRVSEKKVTKTVDQGVSEGKIYNDGKIVYEVMLEGVTEDDLPLTLVDKYSEYLELKTTDLYGTAPKIVGQNDPNGYYSRSDGSSLSFDDDLKDDTVKHELTITVTKEKIPKNGEGKLYPYYFIYYPMQFTVTNELAAKAAANGGIWGINNSVEWADEKGGTEITYEYSGMTKSILGSGPSKDNSWTAEFELDVNPGKVDLVDGSDEVIIEDTMSNLMFKPDTLTVNDTDTSGEALDYDFSYTTDAEGKLLLSIKIKNGDKRHLKIKYQAQVIGNGSVKITNDAKIKGTRYGNSTSRDVTVQTDGGGSGSQQKITVYKYKEGSISTPLPGAQFKLYIQHDGTWKECNPAGKAFFEVNSKGTVDISGDADVDGWTLTAGTWKLVETKTPEGYEGNLNKEVIFTLGNSLTGASNEYIFGSTIPIPNDNAAGSLKLIKAIGGDLSADAQTLKKTFKFTVKGPDNKYYGPSGQISDDPIKIEVTAETPVTLSDLPLGDYTVEELLEGTDVIGYTLNTEITNDGVVTVAAGSTTEATVTNTYTRKITGSFTVTKAVTGDKAPAEGEEYTVEITTTDNVNLNMTDVVVTGAVSGSVSKDTKRISFKIKNKDSVTVTGLPQATYTVTETLASGAQYSASYVVDDGESQTIAPTVTFDTDTTAATVAITNDYGSDVGKLLVKKVVTGTKAPDPAVPYDVTVETADGSIDLLASSVAVTVTGAVKDSVENEAKKITFQIMGGNTVTIDGLPLGTYTVTETVSGEAYTAN